MLDAEELFAIARTKSVEGRTRLAEVVTDLFVDNGGLNDAERALMFDILHRLVHEVEMSMRVSLSEALSQIQDVPRQLALDLANDRIEVARPILNQSKSLHNEDLVEIIFNRTLEHRLAVAIRSDIGEEVSQALVASGEEEVIRKLLENKNACIAEKTFHYIVEESKRVNSYQEPLLRREDIPMSLVHQMFGWVSAALRQHIIQTFEIDEKTLGDLIGQLSDTKIAELSKHRQNPTKVQALVQELKSENMLDSDLMVRSLRQGVVSLFLATFEELTGLESKLSQRIIFDPRSEGLAISCRAINLEEDTFEEVFRLTRNARPQTRIGLDKEVDKIAEFYRTMTSASAQKVLKMWQDGVDYQNAMHELEI